MFATIVTLIALPTLWLASRDEARDGTGAPSVAAVGAADAVNAATSEDAAPATATTTPASGSGGPGAQAEPLDGAFGGDGFNDTHPVFLDGPVKPPSPVVLNVAVPTTDPSTAVTGLASYVRSGTPTRCDSPHAPLNATIRVTNVNNGRTVTCQNTFTFGLANGLVIVLDESAFLQIGDLVDAPVPVRISW